MLDYAHDHAWASATGRNSSTQFTLNCYEGDIGVWGNCPYLLKAENSTCPWWEGDLFSRAVRWSQWVQRFFHSFACQAEGCFEGRGKLCPWPQRGAINRNSKEAQGLPGWLCPSSPSPAHTTDSGMSAGHPATERHLLWVCTYKRVLGERTFLTFPVGSLTPKVENHCSSN